MGSAWRYFAWVPHLARDYRVLRIDRRGFGKSDPMPADFPWSLDIMVDDTVSVIEAQAPAGAHVIGCKIATPLSIRLAQAVHHGTDHRSQICKALTSLGIEPPFIDVWAFGETDGRVIETPPTS